MELIKGREISASSASCACENPFYALNFFIFLAKVWRTSSPVIIILVDIVIFLSELFIYKYLIRAEDITAGLLMAKIVILLEKLFTAEG